MHKIEDLTADELSIIALAVDYFLCNYDHGNIDIEQLENLFMHLDIAAEAAEEAESKIRLIERSDNLLVVDFRPKND